FDNMPSIITHVRNGSLRGVAVTTRERVPVVPDVPTIGETVQGYDVISWFGFFVPVKTSAEIVAKINTDTNAALVDPTVKARFEDLGAVPKGSTQAELAAFLQSETDKWGPGDPRRPDQAGELSDGTRLAGLPSPLRGGVGGGGPRDTALKNRSDFHPF